MRTARVVTNETCNQNCAFCNARRTREERSFIAPAAVRRRITGCARADTEVILTGGEPTLRRDLEALIRHAKSSGAKSVCLETNAALIDDNRARSLADAGLDAARVHAPAWDESLDEITRDPGAFDATLAGAQALASVGVRLMAAAPVVRANAETLTTLPAQLAESGLPWQALEVGVPVEAPDTAELIPIRQAAEIIAAMDASARASGIPLQFGAALIPPCAFESPSRIAHLFSLTAGGSQRPGYRRPPECAGCRAEDRCPGFPIAALERDPELHAAPVTEDRVRRRLSMISSVESQVRRELAQDDVYRAPDGSSIPARIVRINFQCNQSCHFCFVSTHLPTADDLAIRREITTIARRGGVAVLSGGEPTLNPNLLDYVRLARSAGASHVELQTNAIRLGRAGVVNELAAAGVNQLHISLHGSTAEISDTVTNAPGTFEKTVLGIDAAVDAAPPLTLRLNFVFCEANRRDFPAFVDLVAARWPSAHIIVSFVAASTDVVPRSKELVPRYSDVLGYLSEGCRRAAAQNITVTGLESLCGIPLCLVPGDLSGYFELAQIPEGLDRGETVKADACSGCALTGRCFGLRRSYAELHGSSELRPVANQAAFPSQPSAPSA